MNKRVINKQRIFVLYIFWLNLLKQNSVGACSPTVLGNFTFGSSCQYLCQCKNATEQCDETTGDCHASGCADKWMGPGCQYVDIAFGGSSQHSDNLFPMWNAPGSMPAFLANNGNRSECSFTAETNSTIAYTRILLPYWKVYLNTGYLVRGVMFHTLENKTDVFKGFSIHVENIPKNMKKEPNYVSGNTTLCYQHPAAATVYTTMDVFCDVPAFGNTIRIQLSNKFDQLVLCDVRVFAGCNSTTWGPVCSNICGKCLNGTICTITSGICNMGCKAGYKPPQCHESCDDSRYGYNCNQICSGHCQNGAICNKVTGYCPNHLCEPGWKGHRCSRECNVGTYGADCSNICSGHCNGATKFNCNHMDGSCPDGCEAGWRGTKCSEECNVGTYGADCSNICSGFCNGATTFNCNHIDGSCPDGCEAGWRGTICNEECNVGTYGADCSNICSGHCDGATKLNCNHIDGRCPDGCEAGWRKTNCSETCNAGTYGVDCLNTCSGHCNDTNKFHCNRIDGSCLDGCEPGWKGTTCSEDLSGTDGNHENTCTSTIIVAAVLGICLTVSLICHVFTQRQWLVSVVQSMRKQFAEPTDIELYQNTYQCLDKSKKDTGDTYSYIQC